MASPRSASAGASFRTDALVLRLVDYAEADRIVTLLSRSHGKIAAWARAAKKSRGRFGGALALFVAGQATLKPRRGSDLFVLERFDAAHDYSRMAGDVIRFAHASYATELVRELLPAGQAEPAVFDLLVELFDVLLRLGPRADTLRAFELRLLDEIGLRPVLDRCVVCGAEDADLLDRGGAVVVPERGGLVCAACAARAGGAGARRLSGAARRRLLAVRDVPLQAAAEASPAPAEVAACAREAVQAILGAHLRRPLKSWAFLEQLRH